MSLFAERLYIDDNMVSRLGDTTTAEQDLADRRAMDRAFVNLWAAVKESPEDAIESVESTHDKVWADIEDGTLCQLRGTLKVPSIVAMMATSGDISSILRIGQNVGALQIGGEEDERLAQIEQIGRLMEHSIPAILTCPGIRRSFILRLERSGLRVQVPRLGGVVTVYARVGEHSNGAQLLDLGAFGPEMNRAQRRGKSRKSTVADNDLVVKGATTTIRVLAVEK